MAAAACAFADGVIRSRVDRRRGRLIARSFRVGASMMRRHDALIALPSIMMVQRSRRLRTRKSLRNIRRCRALKAPSFDDGMSSPIEPAGLQLNVDNGASRVQRDRGRYAGRFAVLHQLAAASLNDTSSARNAYPAFSVPFARHGAGHTSIAGTLCASQWLVRNGKGGETSPERSETNEKTKAKRKRFALRYSRPMMCPSWNKPKAVRLAWQARRSPLLGRRTGAERLYSDNGHRGGARLATFARTRIRGFEEVLRARDGRA